MEQKTYWGSVSQTKHFTTPFQADAFCKYVKKDANVLDVGCGYSTSGSRAQVFLEAGFGC